MKTTLTSLVLALLLALPALAAAQDEEPPQPSPEEPAAETEQPAEQAAPETAEGPPEAQPEEPAPEPEEPPPPPPAAEDPEPETEVSPEPEAKADQPEPEPDELHWRDDPSTKRHPGSYIGFGAGYAQVRAWVEANEEHGDLDFGPLHTWYTSLRVGDAFLEWFAVGFQVEITNTTSASGKEQVGAFDLLLDVSFYPIEGLGIRPAVGLGLGFASGEEDWEFGGGGPGCFSLSVLYEFRILQLLAIAPVVQGFWITGQDFDGLFLFFGIEFIKWFETPTG